MIGNESKAGGTTLATGTTGLATGTTGPAASPAARSLWPAGIVLFFVVLAVFNAILLFLAYSRRPAAVVANPYEDSLNYEDVIKRERLTEQLGLTIALQASSVRADGNRDVALEVHSVAPAESWAQVSLTGQRPADQRLDTQQIALSRSPDNPAVWKGSLPLAAPGMWMFTVILRDNEGQEALVKLREILP